MVEAEGLREFHRRGEPLQVFLQAYGWEGPPSGILATLDRVVAEQIGLMRSRAATGDPTYERMQRLGRHLDLEAARREIEQVIKDCP